MENINMEGKRLKLRKLRLSDTNAIYENIKHKEIVMWTSEIPHPYSKKEAVKFIRKSQHEIIKKKGYNLGIVLKETNELIGVVSLMKINLKNKNADLGYWLGKKYWKKGIMTESVKLILKFAFEKLKLNRVCSCAFEKNIASQRVLEKCGFKKEGIKRKSFFKHNKFHDSFEYGILRTDYR